MGNCQPPLNTRNRRRNDTHINGVRQEKHQQGGMWVHGRAFRRTLPQQAFAPAFRSACRSNRQEGFVSRSSFGKTESYSEPKAAGLFTIRCCSTLGPFRIFQINGTCVNAFKNLKHVRMRACSDEQPTTGTVGFHQPALDRIQLANDALRRLFHYSP
jgi:hypothetical protein